MVSLPDGLLERIDEEARASGRNRSGLLQHAMRLYLAGSLGRTPPGERPEVRDAMARADSVRARVKTRSEDSTALIRAARDARPARRRRD